MATEMQATDIQKAQIEALFREQKQHHPRVAQTSARERIGQLKRLRDALLRYRQPLQDAMWEDFRKPPTEVDLSEIYPITSEIRFAIRNLRRWMRPRRVSTPLVLFGGRSYIQYQPKGLVLILAPWNYPVNLTLGPLVSAIAAGNSAILKPSENTPRTSAVMKKLIDEAFDPREVALVEGGVETAKALLDLPFNHIFFTGAAEIGKSVMKAAARHLASVTLELGGKSPTIIDESANLDRAAGRIAWAKFINKGQTCVAPDYLFIHESRKAEFLEKLEKKIYEFYGADIRQSGHYARMVNGRHFDRVNGYLEEALSQGARVEIGGQTDEAEAYIAPTVLTGVPADSLLMSEEIFGPLLPVYTFRKLEEVLPTINSREKPLALYIYSRNRKNIRYILENTRAGASCINHSAVHFGNPHLPFGGDNHSGIGKAHGRYGFEAFSNARAIYKQVLPFNASGLLTAPYTRWKQKIMSLVIKWL